MQYLAARWSDLPPHVRETILTLCHVASGGDTHGPEQSPTRTAARLLLAIPPGRRPAVFTACVRFLPSAALETEFQTGPIRAALADAWYSQCGTVPMAQLRQLLADPANPQIWSLTGKLRTPSDISPMILALVALIGELNGRCAAVVPAQ